LGSVEAVTPTTKEKETSMHKDIRDEVHNRIVEHNRYHNRYAGPGGVISELADCIAGELRGIDDPPSVCGSSYSRCALSQAISSTSIGERVKLAVYAMIIAAPQ
jgi:hypothetical protein